MGSNEPIPRLLIVDEGGDCRLGLSELLRGLGFEVVSVGSYAEGTRALQRAGQHFDLVILNVTSSPRKGLEWLRQTSAARLRLGLFPDGVLCVASEYLDEQLELDFNEEGGKVVYERSVRFSNA